MSDQMKWTVLTYIAAHNNLDLLGRKNLGDILKVGSSAEVVQGVLYDGHTGGGRYVMGEPGFASHQEPHGSSFDSGDPTSVVDAAIWLFERHPADRYGLVLWSHGTGWEPSEIEQVTREARPAAKADAKESRDRARAPGGSALFRSTLRTMLEPSQPGERAILFDDGTGHSLDTIELGRVAKAIAERLGQPLDLLGMDACLMGNLEVAYELRKDARCLVASQELVPGHSWPYTEIYGALAADPGMTCDALARLVVDRYVGFYVANPPSPGDVTKVALDLSKVGELAGATSDLAGALTADMARHADALWAVQGDTSARETEGGKRKDSKFKYHLWDVGTVAAGLAAAPAASDAVKAAARRVLEALAPGAGSVLAEGHLGKWFDGIGGVSVYLIRPGQQRLSPSYRDLGFAKETKWLAMLEAYHQQLA